MFEQHRPRVSRRRRGVVLQLRHRLPGLHQRQLHRSARRLRRHGWHHLVAQLGVRPQNSRIAQHVKTWSRDEGDKPTDEAQWVKHHLAGAVAKCFLHRVVQAAVRQQRQPLLAVGRSRDVAAQPLQTLAISAVDGRSGVNVHPANLAAQSGRPAARSALSVLHQAQRGLPGARPQQLSPCGCSLVARRQHRLVR
jgi:hypothetical protein